MSGEPRGRAPARLRKVQQEQESEAEEEEEEASASAGALRADRPDQGGVKGSTSDRPGLVGPAGGQGRGQA